MKSLFDDFFVILGSYNVVVNIHKELVLKLGRVLIFHK